MSPSRHQMPHVTVSGMHHARHQQAALNQHTPLKRKDFRTAMPNHTSLLLNKEATQTQTQTQTQAQDSDSDAGSD